MRTFRECLRGLAHTLRPLRCQVLVSSLAGIVGVAASLAFVWASKRVVDIATGTLDLPLGRYAVIFVSILAVQIVCRVFLSYWNGLMTVKAQNSLRISAFRKVMHSTWVGRERFHSGDMVNRLEEDIRVIVDFICTNLPELITTVVQLVAATFFLFMLQPSLGWVLVFIMPVAVVGSRLFFRKMRALTNEIRTLDGSIQSHMQENIQHRIVVRTLGGTAWVLRRLGIIQEDVKDKTVVRLNYSAVSRAFMNLGFSGGYAIAFLWGAYGLRNGTVTYGLMVAFLQLVGQVQRPVADIARHIPAFIRALSSEDRLMDLLEQPQDAESDPVMIPGAPGVKVVGLSFAYEGQEKAVFENLDFDFTPGTLTAIMGHTGAGKSTLIRVIMNILEPTGGSVTIYGPGVSYPSGPDTRCNFMYVPQGNSLMSGTIRQNLLLADPEATEEKMREALETAVAEFVLDLPQGLDTPCSEVGTGLSEGQAQRIAIARALLRPGGILVLDEATSALDAGTEEELLRRLGGRCHGTKTILCVTHRPAVTAFADRILEMSR